MRVAERPPAARRRPGGRPRWPGRECLRLSRRCQRQPEPPARAPAGLGSGLLPAAYGLSDTAAAAVRLGLGVTSSLCRRLAGRGLRDRVTAMEGISSWKL